MPFSVRIHNSRSTFSRSTPTRRAASAAAITALVAGLCVALPGSAARADEYTVSQNIERTSWDQSEPNLNPGTVSSSDFGQMFNTTVNGSVYAQPLAVNGTIVVATENDNVYGLNEQTGAIEWSDALGTPWPASTISCGDLTPNIGITSTPVYDPATNSVYLTAKINDGATAATPHWYMEALNPATGAEQPGWPMAIGGTPANDPGVPFNPEIELQRPGLLLLNGVVYAGFGSDCDYGPYRGYVVGVNATTAAQTTMWTDEATSSDTGGGIWQAGGGLLSDGTNIYVGTGNGISAPAGPGDQPPPSLSESVVKLAVGSDGNLTATDFFSPSNAPALDANDLDLASGGPVLLPSSFGTTSVPNVIVIAGKDGRVFLLNADDLGGRSQGPNGTDDVVGVTGPVEGEWGHPAVWGGDGGYVYMVGNNGPLRALKRGVSSTGMPTLSLAGASSDNFGYTSGSPVVTSDGTTSGSAVVWVVWASGSDGSDAQLRAYNAVPDNNGILDLLYSVPIGDASKFTVPLTDGNRVFVGTRDGHVMSFGSPATTAVSAGSVAFGNTLVGQTATATATVTANQNLTITGATAAAPYGVASTTFPITVTAGSSVQLPLTFTPTSVGTSIGVLSVATSAGTVGIGLDGFGTEPGLSATPTSLDFAAQPTGSTYTDNVEIENTSTKAETINSFTLPSAPFTVTGLPPTGTVVPVGNSFVFTVAYSPTVASNDDTGTVSITSTSGTVTVPLTGSAVTGSGNLVLTPATTNFGYVTLGDTRTLTFDLKNTGNLPVTLSKAKAPDSEFTAASPMSEGLVIGPGEVVTQAITFTASTLGAATDHYEITGADNQGELYEYFSADVINASTLPVPSPAAATWSTNGSAQFTSGGVQLTSAALQQAGSSYYDQSVPTANLEAVFTAQIGPGTGADGLTFGIANAADSTPATLGLPGGGLGFSSTDGYAVALCTHTNAQAGSSNYVAILQPSSAGTSPTYLATAPVPTPLRSGTHNVVVTTSNGNLNVSVDGTQLLSVPVTLPPYAYVGFTAGNGGAGDVHAVSNVDIEVNPSAAAGSLFTPIAPTRILDTRAGTGAPKAQVARDGTIVLQVTKANGIPAGATAVAVNITATDTSGSGFVIAYPDGGTVPNVSNLNYTPGTTVPNSAIVPLGSDGAIDLYNGGGAAGSIDLIADVTGYFSQGTGDGFTSLSPDRLLDTRAGTGTGGKIAKVAAGHSIPLTIADADSGDLPVSGIAAVALNVTVTNTTGSGFISVYPGGSAIPTASNLNYRPGQTVANTVIVPVSSGGVIDLYNGGSSAAPVDLLADVTGYFAAGSPGIYVPVTPTRLLDTRTTSALPKNGKVTLAPAALDPSLAGEVTGFAFNVTVTQPTGSGFVAVYPDGSAVPTTSNVNYVPGLTVANLALATPGPDGDVDFINGGSSAGSTQLIVDVFGYFTIG